MYTLAFLNSLGTWDLVIILALGLLLFGKKLPDVGRGIGRSIVEFKKGLREIDEEVDRKTTTSAPPRAEFQEPAYRPPLAQGGQDVRVSRADAVDAQPAPTSHAGPTA